VSDEERSGYSPYSLDLAPSDYHLFLHRKAFLAAHSLRGDQDTKDFVKYWLNVLATTFDDEDLQNLVPRYLQCLNLHGDYVGKQFNVGTSTLQHCSLTNKSTIY
jgi:hypothetical protein